MSSSKVKVAVRVRPFNSREVDLEATTVVDMDETQTFLTHPSAGRDRKENTKTFAYDHCFWSMDENNEKFANQEKVFRCLGTDVLANAFEGYNACIFAYGQTGSGKSYTMMGTSSQTGIIPRLCNALFDQISNNIDENLSFKVEVSYIEIYNEKVRDLLNPRGGKQNLKVREHKVLGPYVDGLTKLVVSSFQDIDSLMIEGNKSRTVAATNMNSESSRSHAVFNIVLTQAEFDNETQTIGEKASKLSLVDLAGSERASKTGTTGDRLREGSNINKSLHTLGLVISALADQAAHAGSHSSHKSKKTFFVPYRDSVLTWLLKDNLGGNSKTVMVATISPASDNYEETMSTLRYADRAKRIVNHAVINEDPNAKIIRELREEVERLRQILKIKGFSDSKDEIKEKLTESENLMEEFTMTWEEKEKNTEIIKQERHKALEDMGISIQSSGIAVEKNKFYLVNLNADPSLNEMLVYYLKDHTAVGRPDAVHHTDIQLRGLGILPEHCALDIVENEVFLTPLPNARTCRNGVVVTEKTVLHHGDRILWGNNHFFRINCPRPPGAVNEPEELVDYEFAQREICMNDRSSDISEDAMAVLEEKHKIDKEEALVKQRQMYEEKIERMKYEMSPAFRPERTSSLASFSSSGISSSRLSFNDELDTLEHERYLEKLKEEVVQGNALVREANQLSEEMKRDTEFAVTLQIPTSGLSLNRSRGSYASEVAIVVKHKNKGTQFWSLDKLSNKIYDMRDAYNQIEEGNNGSKVSEDDDLFFEVECHTLIGVANVYLECIFLDVPLDYAAPIISQQGEVCGRLKVEITRSLESKEADAGSLSDEENEDDLNEEELEDHDEEISVGQPIAVKVKILEAYDLPPAYCNYVFCQYEFWDQPNVVELSSPGSKNNSVVFTEEQVFRFEATEEFLEYISEGALSIEIWGNRSKGFGHTSWTPNIQPTATNTEDGWNDLTRKVDMWVEIHELSDQGVFSPVEVHTRNDNETGGIFQLRHGQSRRLVVGIRPLPKSGSLPVVIETISAVEIGSVRRRDKNDDSLDSYQDKDLSLLREKLSTSLMKKREYLDEQIQLLMSKKDKSPEDKERESWLIDQWVNLTEEKNFLLHPQAGSNVPGAPSDRPPTAGMEKHIPVIFLDLNAEGLHSTSVDESSVAGLNSPLPFEVENEMKEVPVFKYDQKNVSMTVLWDSSTHDSVYLNRATSSSERVYLVIKAHVRLSSPLAMDLILRKRICVRIYKRQSLKDTLMRRLWKDTRTRCGVTYELVSHIPRQPGEETEERGNLAERAAAAVSADDEEHEVVLEKYHRGISHVEGLLKLDKLRQEVVVKEKLAASGKPLRKFASTPNLLQGSFDLSSIGTKNDSLDAEFGQGTSRKGSPATALRHVHVSFDEWDNISSPVRDTSPLVPTIISSTPNNTLETVKEQSAPSSPLSPGITETTFPYTAAEKPRNIVRSLELEFTDEKESPVPREERPPNTDPLGNIPIVNEPLRNLPVVNHLTEIPIEFENVDTTSSMETNPETTTTHSDDVRTDVVTVHRISERRSSDNLLSNSVDSGLHESTDQLSRDTKELVSQEDLVRDLSPDPDDVHEGDNTNELKLGQVITVSDSKIGIVRYIGNVEFATGEWIGVQLELPVGKNDGSVNNKRYFKCKPKYGTFVRRDKVTASSSRPKSTSSSKGTTNDSKRKVSGVSSSPGLRSNTPSLGNETSRPKRNNTSEDREKRRSNILF